MGFISRIIFSFFSNLIALVVAGNFIPGFELTDNFVNLLITAGVFMLINIYIRPLIKMILSPLVILTLGLFTLVINAGMLYLLDILSENVTITGIEPLIYGTLLMTGVNLLLHFSAKFLS
ncbi:MAG: phage holin family protein [Candidatus Harrisonbacteria bacterium]|nr:phage holin family protein [Candidatus Harrisonbacteria bacterium]